MKIKPEHAAHIRTCIRATFTPVMVDNMRATIKAEGKARDPEMRLRWDLTYGAGLSQWLCDNIYPYANDAHLDTVLRGIVSEYSPR